jgi:hypothetical protein
LACFTVILVNYLLLAVQTQPITINIPSKSDFEQLEADPIHSAILVCPCENISVSYSTFISLAPRYHHVCRSDFITIDFLKRVFHPNASLNYPYFDYRLFVFPQFQWLSSLCTLAEETVSAQIDTFFSKAHLTGQVHSRSTVETQARAAITHFKLSTTRTFNRSLDLILKMMDANSIVSAIQSNCHFVSFYPIDFLDLIASEPRSYGNDSVSCMCGINPKCTSVAKIDTWQVPGFQVGYDILVSLLQSTLQCLYNTDSINTLTSIYNQTAKTFQALNDSVSSPSAIVQSLIDVLMVDQWTSNINYDRYYSVCALRTCTFSRSQNPDTIYAITKTISLLGEVIFRSSLSPSPSHLH